MRGLFSFMLAISNEAKTRANTEFQQLNMIVTHRFSPFLLVFTDILEIQKYSY